ncbi:Saccharopine dehydrogenase [Dermatophilus congolensis]|uniref:Saccharopine dehydrogenase n=1 Tax=Dermatophilus congolensis TaxID=1863 RepID=A0AA46BMX7_9MICO|nr:saccharopine dehydrogenase NADP-binding domain-containing protein [Dermatophilus congolensis]STD08196.1 Saccharopine dehydrogenase [Dermatophilus congolensis]
MTRRAVGVIGASGDIGQRAVEALLRLGALTISDLTLAGRRVENIPAQLHGQATQRRALDVTDTAELARFATDHDVVLDVTGPAHQRALNSAAVISEHGTHVVAVGGPADARSVQNLHIPKKTTALFYAGAIPGASGIIPRALLQQCPTARTLEVLAGGVGAFTLAGAEDYLAGLAHGDVEPMAAWREGAVRSGAATRIEQVRLAEFTDPVSLFPYCDLEGQVVAQEHHLTEATWYSVMSGEGIAEVLQVAAGMGIGAGAQRLRDASMALAAGRRVHVMMRARTEDQQLVLRAPGEAVLAGCVAAVAVNEILAGQVGAGAAIAAHALDPQRVVAALSIADQRVTVTRSCVDFGATAEGTGVDMDEGEL